MPDWDQMYDKLLYKRVQYHQRLCNELKSRFHSECLGQLRQMYYSKPRQKVKLGAAVMIGNSNKKQLDWPLGLVVAPLWKSDGVVCLVRLKTTRIYVKTCSALFPLECMEGLECKVIEGIKPLLDNIPKKTEVCKEDEKPNKTHEADVPSDACCSNCETTLKIFSLSWFPVRIVSFATGGRLWDNLIIINNSGGQTVLVLLN